MTLEFTETHHIVDLLTNGLRFFSFCVDDATVFSSILQTTNLFAGGFTSSKFIPFVGSKVPSYMIASNLDFLEKYTGKNLEKRVITDVKINSSLIKDGDLFLSRRMDGMDPFYMLSTGGTVAHAAVALWDENGEDLWICEA